MCAIPLEAISSGVRVGAGCKKQALAYVWLKPPDWLPPSSQVVAACKQEDPDLFFPQAYTISYLPQIQRAKDVCYSCPLLESCLHWALYEGGAQLDGVWAATTPKDRYRFRTGRTDDIGEY